MPVEIYEIVALAARFWFLFLMFMIVWRSYRWYARERSQRKKRLRLLPDAGYIGEFVVMQGAGDLERGQVLSVPFEGTLGFVRSNDLCVPAPGVAHRHLWFSYDERQGLVMTSVGKNDFSVDQITIGESPEGLCMAHGSRLYIGECELRLRMFAGYEVNRVMSPPAIHGTQNGWEEPEGEASAYGAYTPFVPDGLYGAGDRPVARPQAAPYAPVNHPSEIAGEEAQEYGDEPYDAEEYDELDADGVFYDEEDFAQPEDWVSSSGGDRFARPMTSFAGRTRSPYARPVSAAPADRREEPVFHPLLDEEDWDEGFDDMEEPVQSRQASPVMTAASHLSRPGTLNRPRPLAAGSSNAGAPETARPATYPTDEAWPVVPRPEGWRSEGLFDDLVDEDGTDASMPPKSAYVGKDEAAWAKRQVWDKYFGGGDAP